LRYEEKHKKASSIATQIVHFLSALSHSG